jgi:hypothetical protein
MVLKKEVRRMKGRRDFTYRKSTGGKSRKNWVVVDSKAVEF